MARVARGEAVEGIGYIPGVLCGVVGENEIAESVEYAAELLEGVEDLYAIDGLPVRASDREVEEAIQYE